MSDADLMTALERWRLTAREAGWTDDQIMQALIVERDRVHIDAAAARSQRQAETAERRRQASLCMSVGRPINQQLEGD